MMISATVGRLLLSFCAIRLSNSERGVIRLSSDRVLSRWPAKDGSTIPRTRTESKYQWEHSGHEDLGYQEVIRAGGDPPEVEGKEYGDHADDQYYDDEVPIDDHYKYDDDYYREKDNHYSSKMAKKGPADKEFEYIEFVHGDGKGKGKGEGEGENSKGSKGSKMNVVDCEYYYEDDEYLEHDYSYSYNYSYDHGKGKGKGKGGKGEGKGEKDPSKSDKKRKSDKKTKICPDPPGKLTLNAYYVKECSERSNSHTMSVSSFS
jgi:hypothetical protein